MALLIFAIVLFILQAQSLVLPDIEQFSLRLVKEDVEEALQQDQACSSKIAIIGSGITGAITAFKLHEDFKRRFLPSQRPCITVFERNPIVGGRITEAYVYDDPSMPVDTCAATFAALDTCVALAVGDVGLFPSPEDLLRPQAGTGIWDGTDMLDFVDQDDFRNPFAWSYYKEMKYLPRYKDIPQEFDLNVSIVRQNFDLVLPPLVADQFEAPPAIPPGIKNLSDELKLNGLDKFVQSPICYDKPFDFVYSQREAAQRFLSELAYPGLRERFFIDGLDFKVLEFYLGFEDALPISVQGGNLRLIERLLKLSGADVRLNTIVQKIEDGSSSFGYQGSLVTSLSTTEGGFPNVERFDTVVIATSLARGNITFKPALPDLPGLTQEYRDSVVTHFTTTGQLDPAFFRWNGTMPQNILTTDYCRNKSCNPPPFFSLTLLRLVVPPGDEQPKQVQNLFKLVSREEVSNAEILRYLSRSRFASPDDPSPISISWIHREILPQSVPITRADRQMPCRAILEDIEIAKGIFYAGGGEQVVASAEFGCRMGDNVANLVLGRAVDRFDP